MWVCADSVMYKAQSSLSNEAQDHSDARPTCLRPDPRLRSIPVDTTRSQPRRKNDRSHFDILVCSR